MIFVNNTFLLLLVVFLCKLASAILLNQIYKIALKQNPVMEGTIKYRKTK